VHVESPLQSTEQLSVHRTLHVEPPVQSMLALVPTTRSQIAPSLHDAVHEAPHVPLHCASPQSSVQLSPAQAESARSHVPPTGHEHDEPVQSGGGGASLPHATPMIKAK
jgi:hypothetical protein